MALRNLSSLDAETRKKEGQKLNGIKEAIMQAFASQEVFLEKMAWNEKLAHETLDVTLPGHDYHTGRFHPLMQTMAECIEIFSAMGFSLRKGPDIETEFYNFDALNVPPDHPARAPHKNDAPRADRVL